MTDERNTDRLVVIGANHRTSSEATRDRLFIPEDEQKGFLRSVADSGLEQAVVLSTCARTEILTFATDPEAARLRVLDLLAGLGGLPVAILEDGIYLHHDVDAIRHVFRVAASLDSPIVGEPEVTGQFREAVRIAVGCGMVGSALDAVVQAASSAAKRVRNETAIGEKSVSMAACALQVARDVQGDLSRVSALLVAGGEMGELIVDQMRSAGLSQITVAARSKARAEISARRFSSHHASLDDLSDILPRMDIVVSSLGAGHYLMTLPLIKSALDQRRLRPMLFVDAAIPSDVDPAVNDLDGAFVYALDDLERIAMEGRSHRDEAATVAEAVIEDEVGRFLRTSAARAAVPTVAALRDHFESVQRDVQADLRITDPATEEALRRLVNRLLHRPTESLRELAADNEMASQDAENYVRLLFGLGGNTEDDR